MNKKCRIISNEQLDVLYEVEKFLLDRASGDGFGETLEKLTVTIRELDPSSDHNLKLEVNNETEN